MTEDTNPMPTNVASASGNTQACTLDESTRLYYLEAMGIQCWQSLQPVQEVQEIVEPAVSVETEAGISKPQAADRSIGHAVAQPLDWPSLETSIQRCEACQLHVTRKQALIGRGNAAAELMFILLAPDSVDEEAGLICSGEADALFSKMLAAIDIDIKHVYITSLIKCRPPQNHTISPREIMCCSEHLKQQIELVKPSIVVVLGETAIQCLLQKPQPIDRLRADINSVSADTSSMNPLGSMPLFVSHSPHELLQKAELKRNAWSDLQQLQKLIHHD